MSDDNAPVMITAQADRNFVTILNAYKHLKTIKKITLICVLILTMVPFVWGVSTLAVVLTLALCLGTLVYLHSCVPGASNQRITACTLFHLSEICF